MEIRTLNWSPVSKDDDEYNDDGWGPHYPERERV